MMHLQSSISSTGLFSEVKAELPVSSPVTPPNGQKPSSSVDKAVVSASTVVDENHGWSKSHFEGGSRTPKATGLHDSVAQLALPSIVLVPSEMWHSSALCVAL